MWARIKRIFRSIIGFFIDLGEDAELILKQNIRDMEDQIPTMNEGLAMMGAQVSLTQKALARAQQREKELTIKIKASLKHGKRDLALNFATTLEEVRVEMASEKRHHKLALASFEKGKKVKAAYLRQMESKINEAKKALRGKRQTEWNNKVADAMASFKVAGIDATHDEMVAKLEQDAALAEGKLEMAMDGLAEFDIEEEAQAIQANDTLRQFEIEMGIVTDISAPPAPAEENEEASQVKELA